ncbi:tRNA (5-methylaminomethyl-2-thiouridine)(34)-methyltransferase MnmD [Histidinibacterium aquaticum]|uniref:tRNA (5-methylaminomethyl-2-thiouridine)(34)-methyltransferase MnmD n=1 Tax=Histidinibacterium aquaticum TaxID=2613962 RepID=A0A5J5GE02_9RHOB|nr:tRNA (5-methylaminomethyl-2-thiouridine)(34)-methyltransferase MnmD [Histidinibacterium aquaticum]KAA9006068.1 tRNA (5-methylaminomethyl-2-thiouridine)(34)-methyltransferase MnmD [Histidinibacterium aquaticum]
MQGQTAEVAWSGETPVATRFDDPYYSLQGGPAETAHVFLAGNALPGRFRDGFHVAELGFGTGLNALVAWTAFRAAVPDGTLRFTSFEAYPMAPGDMARALSACGAPAAETRQLLAALTPGGARLPGLDLTVVEGDARETLPRWTGRADAWFLDGFSPAKNPELWEPGLMREVALHTAPGGTLATYTAAGHVRRTLAEAGFEVARAPGFGRKRHMTTGRLE